MQSMAQLEAEQAFEQTQYNYRFLDDDAQVAYERRLVREHAESLLETRRMSQINGAEHYLTIDALSTARAVITAEAQYGTHSTAHNEAYDGLVLDCSRLVGEWYRKNTSEYFAPVRHVYDADKAEFFSHGLSIRQMTENALTPFSDNPEEEARRINERVEDATPQILRSLGKIALGTEHIRTISECTDKAITEYAEDQRLGRKHRGYDGYVPEIQKVMLRDIWLDTDSNDRFEEQIGLPGTYITHEIIQIALAERGAVASDMDKTSLHGAQLLADDTLLDFAAHLDAVATREWSLGFDNKALFMGEVVAVDHPRDYLAFKQEALARQAELKSHAETVALFVLDLAAENFDAHKAPAHVENFVKKLLLSEAKDSYEVASRIFDEKTAIGLQAVGVLESRGMLAEARILMQEVEQAAPGGGFCGAGSCGLESVDMTGKAGEQLAEKLGAERGDTIVKDTERACRCGSKSIIYAFNKKKVNKLCQSCGAFESKATSA